jgi:hypothetical protein
MYIYDDTSLKYYYSEKCFRQKLWRKSKHTCYVNNFSQNSCHIWDNVEKYFTAVQATDENIIWHMSIAFFVTKATNMYPKF